MQEFLSLDNSPKNGKKNFQFTLFLVNFVSVLILFRFLPSQLTAFFDTIDLLKRSFIKIHILIVTISI